VAVDEAGRLSAIIGNLYDAALAPERWHTVLGEVRDFVGGYSAAIYAKGFSPKSFAIFHEDERLDPHYKQLYSDRYVAIDPSTPSHIYSSVTSPVSTTDFMPYEEYRKTPIYLGWVRPQGFVDFITVALEKTASGGIMLGIFRKEADGMVDENAKARMRLVAPHVQRAAMIGKTYDLKAAETDSLADTIDGLAVAVFLARPNGTVVHSNAAGRAMFAAGDPLIVVQGRIAARDLKANQALADALSASEAGDRAIGARGAALTLTAGNGESYLAHVLPLTSGARRRAGTAAAAAAVFVRRAGLSMASPPEVIARHFRLTPSELRVLLAIVEVGGVPEVADALGVSDTTVKTHLAHLYGKTGTSRQADLVKLVAGFANPLLA
jgi:DNA-binding CsgD family transcriptional regulator